MSGGTEKKTAGKTGADIEKAADVEKKTAAGKDAEAGKGAEAGKNAAAKRNAQESAENEKRTAGKTGAETEKKAAGATKSAAEKPTAKRTAYGEKPTAKRTAAEFVPAICRVDEATAEAFAAICRRTLRAEHEAAGIGTLSEKTLHATVKAWIAPDGAVFEAPVGRYVADVLAPDGRIYEVQTQGFSRLRDKLDAFLPDHPVTVIYPFPLRRYVCDLPDDPAEPIKKRRSTRPGKVPQAFRELYRIKGHLGRPGVTLVLLLLEVTDYRVPCPTAVSKRGSVRFERMPSALLGRAALSSPSDYAALLPPDLPCPFGSDDLAHALKVRRGDAQTMLNVLSALGGTERVGKRGNAFLYKAVR